ncbi:glycosyltransferase family 2 protein [Planctomicrobium sp. SH664]|uniref:glycosyltransferase family 2 protein n=1 Tax=Planctomicrobium sp. SH664 TaxID=3448125 RepID=UPI003F5B38F2
MTPPATATPSRVTVRTDVPRKPAPACPLVSVFILTRNRLEVLQKAVQSVLLQEGVDFEILILDDASDCGDTAHALTARLADPRIRAFHVTTSLGVAGGRNLLMNESRGAILVSLDDDAVFTHPDALRLAVESFERWPRAGIVAFQITNVIRNERTPLVPFQRRTIQSHPEVVQQPALVASYRGGGHALRREIFTELGGYRSDMMYSGEEMDLAYRVINAGYEIAYQPEVQVDHFPMPSVVGPTAGRKVSELTFHIRNRVYLAWRYLPALYLPSYLSIWLAYYAFSALRTGQLGSFLLGLRSVPGYLRGVKRETFSADALKYLREHNGRLWM